MRLIYLLLLALALPIAAQAQLQTTASVDSLLVWNVADIAETSGGTPVITYEHQTTGLRLRVFYRADGSPSFVLLTFSGFTTFYHSQFPSLTVSDSFLVEIEQLYAEDPNFFDTLQLYLPLYFAATP